MKQKKRNPQDATLRNIRALKKRIRALELAMTNNSRNELSQIKITIPKRRRKK